MPNKIERILKLLKDFNEGRLSPKDELDLYAWRRLLPKNERAYRNRSSGRKICIMIIKFVDELIWREELMKYIQSDEEFKRTLAALNKNISNKSS